MATTNSTTSAYSYLSTAGNRFSGLASGMDIDSLVEKLMKAESSKMEKLQQQKQKYEWQRESYRSINTKLESFRTNLYDNYALSKNFISNKVSVSDESKASVTASSTASGELTISSATLATAAHKVGTPTLANAKSTSTVGELFGTGNLDPNTTYTAKMDVVQQDGKVKTVSINYKASDTLESLATQINSKNAGITAVVGKNDGKFSLTSSATGEQDGGTVRFTSSDGLFQKLGFSSNLNGENATYTINGVEQTSKTNSLTISGYNIELKQNFTDTQNPLKISSKLDTSSIVDKVKSFIETYNTLITDLKTPVNEKKNLDYQPLTDAQRSEMSEEEIKNWEEKAKKGVIKGDTTINSVLSKMRNAISSIEITGTDGKKINIFSLGLDTNTDGTLVLKNENKLTEAIKNNAQDVAKLFTQPSDTTTGAKSGIIESLRDSAKVAIDTITVKAGKETSQDSAYTIGRTLKSIEDQIASWKTRLVDIEERYYKQFTAMEDAISKANSQSSIFAS